MQIEVPARNLVDVLGTLGELDSMANQSEGLVDEASRAAGDGERDRRPRLLERRAGRPGDRDCLETDGVGPGLIRMQHQHPGLGGEHRRRLARWRLTVQQGDSGGECRDGAFVAGRPHRAARALAGNGGSDRIGRGVGPGLDP